MELVEKFDIKQIEKNVQNDLKDKDISKLIQQDDTKKNEIMFIEGPPTMNGIPHAGHLRGRVFKDLWAVRTILVKSDQRPVLVNPHFYGFSSEKEV